MSRPAWLCGCVGRDDLEALTELCAVVPLVEVAANENEAPGVIGRLTQTLGWMQRHVHLSRHRAAKDFRKEAEVGRDSDVVGGRRRVSEVRGRRRAGGRSGSVTLTLSYFVNSVFHDA